MTAARVTVLMPVHDAGPFLREAVESILRQTWRDFELLVIDDGSTDDSPAILDGFAAADRRVRVVRRPHAGLVAALNHGLTLARGEYIARADADDVNLPRRLERQVALLDAAPHLGACGTWLEFLGSGELGVRPAAADALRALLLFEVPIFHPTAVLRRSWMERHQLRYDAAFNHAEDYDLWERGSQTTAYGTVAEVLVRYRLHPGQVSQRHDQAQADAAWRVRRRLLASLGVAPTAAEIAVHEHLVNCTAPAAAASLPAVRAWVEMLAARNRHRRCFPEAAFARELRRRWYLLCRAAAVETPDAVAEFLRCALVRRAPAGWLDALRLTVTRAAPPPLLALARRIRRHARDY